MSLSKQDGRIGEVVLELYRIDNLAGKGAFAKVYHALDPVGKDVAVKVLCSVDETVRLRFAREIKVLRALPRNPSVVGYIDHGNLNDGLPALVTEFVDGITLREGMIRRPRLMPQEAAAFLSQLCHAFTGLHELGVAHRDVKPGNILLTRHGGIKLIDFGLIRDAQGILKLLEDEGSPRVDTRIFSDDIDSGMLAGTVEYMAPEQFSDSIITDLAEARTDTATDVFSIGVILVELLTGRRPFSRQPGNRLEDRGDILDFIRWRLRQTVVGLKSIPGVDPALLSIVQKALNHDPRVRQPDCRALMQDLETYLETGKGVEIDNTRTLSLPMDGFIGNVRTAEMKTSPGTQLPPIEEDDIPDLEMDALDSFDSIDDVAVTDVSPPRVEPHIAEGRNLTVDEEAATMVAPETPFLFDDGRPSTPSAVFFDIGDDPRLKALGVGAGGKRAGRRAANEVTKGIEIEDDFDEEFDIDDDATLEGPRAEESDFAESLEDDETTKWTPEKKKRS